MALAEDLYLGHVDIEGTLTIPFQSRTTAGVAVATDSPPAYRIYGPNASATMSSGTGTLSGPVDSQTGFYLNTHAITSAHGYASGSNYCIRISYVISSVTYVKTYTFSVT